MTGTVCALVPVYAEVEPADLRDALSALASQTNPAEEVLLVADGPLTAELDGVVVDAAQGLGLPLRRLDLPVRAGAGPARAAGAREARGDYVAIVDADDVSLPHRLATQRSLLDEGEVDAVGAAMEEYDAGSGTVLGVRSMPESHADIARLARLNNPINHPTLMVRRELLLGIGAYRDLPGLEDYDLVARMLGAGARLYNSPDVLVKFRGGAAAQHRRRATAVMAAEWRLQGSLRSEGLISGPLMVRNWLLRGAYRLLPAGLALRVYRMIFLRRSSPDLVSDRPEYDRHVDMSEVRGPLGEAFARQALSTAGYSDDEARSLSVLDVGAGYGDTARALAQRCRHVTCLEPARELHERSKMQTQELGLDNMSFVLGGVEDLQDEEAFDLIVLDNVYEHLPGQGEAVDALWHALRPGGRLYLLTPNKLWPIEAHYGLPGLAWLPLPLANRYLRLSGRGRDYTDASYAPTYWSLKRDFQRHGGWDYAFVLPGDPSATVAGQPLHYRVGMAAIRRVPALWAISKALLVVATKRPDGR